MMKKIVLLFFSIWSFALHAQNLTPIDAAKVGGFSGDSLGYFSLLELKNYMTTGAGLSGTGSANHVAFWTDASTLSYDASQFFWDATNNRLGIGTSTPTVNLQLGAIVHAGTEHNMIISGYNDSSIEFNMHGGWSVPRFTADLNGNLLLVNHGSNRTDINLQFGSSASNRGKMQFYYDDVDAIKMGTNSGFPILLFGVREFNNRNYEGEGVFTIRESTSITHEYILGRTGDFITPVGLGVGTSTLGATAHINGDLRVDSLNATADALAAWSSDNIATTISLGNDLSLANDTLNVQAHDFISFHDFIALETVANKAVGDEHHLVTSNVAGRKLVELRGLALTSVSGSIDIDVRINGVPQGSGITVTGSAAVSETLDVTLNVNDVISLSYSNSSGTLIGLFVSVGID